MVPGVNAPLAVVTPAQRSKDGPSPAFRVTCAHGIDLGWVHVHHSLDGREHREGDDL